MFRALLIAAWVVFAVDLVFVFAMLFGDSRGQDAAGRGMQQGMGILGLVIVAIAAAGLYFGGRAHLWWAVAGLFVVLAIPFLIYGSSQIDRMVRDRRYEAYQRKIGAYPDPSQRALAKAIAAGDLGAMRAILAGHPNLSGRDAADYDLLSYAVSQAGGIDSKVDIDTAVEAVRLLLDAGMDANGGQFPNGDGAFKSVTCGLPEPSSARLFAVFLEHGANPNALVLNQPTIFRIGNAPDSLRLLLDHGAGIESRDRDGNTPLLYYVMHSQWDAALLLLDRGADIAVKNNKEETLESLLNDQKLYSEQVGRPLEEGHLKVKAAIERRIHSHGGTM